MPRLLILCVLIPFIASAQAQTSGSAWTKLFNGQDLSGWNKYLGPALDSAGKKWNGIPLGWNNDPQNIFTVVPDNGSKVIRISGQSWGALSTLSEYSNYHLQLQFKWGSHTWAEKRNKPRDSGLLYHGNGEPENSGWMQSQEFQIEENDCGDYWTVGKVKILIRSIKDTGIKYIYDPKGEWKLFGDSGYNWCHRPYAKESPAGQWNTLDLYCSGDTSVHVVNGEVVMILYHSQRVANGRTVPLTRGKIQLQSEGAELYYKEIKIQSISALPVALGVKGQRDR